MSIDSSNEVVNFRQMKDGTREEYLMLQKLEADFVAHTADRILSALESQESETLEGYRVSRLTHALQAATRAWNDGADIDWVIGALLHDIGDGLAPQNHDEFAAAILRPYTREEVVWTVQHHAAFQMVYYAQHYGWNQNEREKFRGSEYFDVCAEFCERWDQASFDPDYPTLPLAFFKSMVKEVFARKPYKVEHLQPGVKKPLLDPMVAQERKSTENIAIR